MKYAVPIIGLAALVTAEDVRRQNTQLFSIPPQPTPLESTGGKLSILPVSTHSISGGATAPGSSAGSASGSQPATTIGHITGSAPPPTGTIITVTTPTSGASQTTAAPSGSSSSSGSASGSKASSTGTQSQTSNPAAAPTVANYVAGVIALAGLAVAL